MKRPGNGWKRCTASIFSTGRTRWNRYVLQAYRFSDNVGQRTRAPIRFTGGLSSRPEIRTDCSACARDPKANARTFPRRYLPFIILVLGALGTPTHQGLLHPPSAPRSFSGPCAPTRYCERVTAKRKLCFETDSQR